MLPAALRQLHALTHAVKVPLRRVRADYRRLTGALRGLPSVLILGAQKAGTTSLFRYIPRHPDVLRPLTKEVHYFDLEHHRGHDWCWGTSPTPTACRSDA